MTTATSAPVGRINVVDPSPLNLALHHLEHDGGAHPEIVSVLDPQDDHTEWDCVEALLALLLFV